MNRPPAILLYALDVDASKTSSLGIFHYTRNLLAAIAEGDSPPFRLVVLTNREAAGSLLPACTPAWMETVVLPGNFSSGWKRIWADHVLSLVYARRLKTPVVFFPKGWIPFPPCPGLRIVTTMHDRMYHHYQTVYPGFHAPFRLWYWGALFKRSLCRADLILTVSDFSRTRLLEAAGKKTKEIEVVHEGPGIPSSGIQPTHPKRSILVIGSTLPHKRTRETLERLAVFLSTHRDPPPVRITGLEAWPDTWGEPPMGPFLYLGRLSDTRLQEEFLQARVLVFLSDMEGFGMPLLEALGHGAAICYRAKHAAAEIFGEVPGGWDGKDQAGFEAALGNAMSISPQSVAAEFRRIHESANWPRSAAEHVGAFTKLLRLELAVQTYQTMPPAPPPRPIHYKTARPLTIVQVFNHYLKPGGEAKSVERIATHLHAAGHRVVRFHRYSEEWLQRGAPSKLLQPLLMVKNPRVLQELRDLQASVRADVWLLHNVQPVVSLEVYRLAGQLGVPIIQWLHNYRPVSPSGTLFANGNPLNPGDKRLVWKEILAGSWRNSRLQTALSAAAYARCFRRGDFESVKAWVGVSEHMMKLFAASGKLPPDRLHALRHAWDRNPLSDQAGEDGYFLFLGRTLTSKGIGFLVNLFSLPELSGCKLIVAGDGEDRPEWEKVSPPNVIWLGWVEHGEKTRLIARCTAVLFPSLWEEPLSTIAYEAYEQEKPVVSSNTGGMPEIVLPGETGYLLPPGVDAPWIDAILGFNKNPDLAKRMGAFARSWLEEVVSADAWNRGFDKIAATVIDLESSSDE